MCGIDKSRVRSLGMFNEKIGINFYNVSFILKEKNNTEFYFSIGTALMISSIGIGWKHYYKKINNKFLPFTSFSIYQRYANKMAVTNGSAIRTDDCIGFSGGVRFNTFRVFKKDMYFQLGGFTTVDFRNDVQLWPFINLEFRYK